MLAKDDEHHSPLNTGRPQLSRHCPQQFNRRAQRSGLAWVCVGVLLGADRAEVGSALACSAPIAYLSRHFLESLPPGSDLPIRPIAGSLTAVQGLLRRIRG